MNLFGVEDAQALLRLPGGRWPRVPPIRRCVEGRCSRAFDLVTDWLTTAAAAGTVLSVGTGGQAAHRLFVDVGCGAFAIAALFVALLASGGAYSKQRCSPIQQVERCLRVTVQAGSLLPLAMCAVGGDAWGLVWLLASAAAGLLLVVEKQIVMRMRQHRITRRAPAGLLLAADLAEYGSIQLGSANRHPDGERLKRALDLIVAAGAIVLISPLWLLIAFLIRIDSPGPVMFRQQRVGRNGTLFTLYKFRSMYSSACEYQRSPSHPADPRITRLGGFLRHSSLDELPQLLNVLRGDMSLVGPRPEMQFVVKEYSQLHRQRLSVLPGITGLWQLSAGRGFQIHANIQYDLYYIRNRNVFMDLAILLYTPFLAMRGI